MGPQNGPAFFIGIFEIMKQQPLESRIAKIVEPAIKDLGFDLYCVKIIGEDGSKTVQIMAEDPATKRLGIDDCTKISRAVSAVLDVEDPIAGRYRLEISSPGIDRILFKPEHFDLYKGFEAKIEIDTPNDDGQRRFRGHILGMANDNVRLKTDTGEVEIPFASLSKAKLVLTDELIKATSNKQV